MDQHIPLEQRQRSVALARELSAQAEATRARQLAAADLGTALPNTPATPVVTAQPRVPAQVASAPVPGSAPSSPRSAGADYSRPPAPAPRPVVVAPVSRPPAVAVAPRQPAPPAAAAATSSGDWRLQLGAFGVAGNAEALWNRVRARPELAGKSRLLVPAGKVTKLQAGGFASQAAAASACGRLAADGFGCIAVRN